MLVLSLLRLITWLNLSGRTMNGYEREFDYDSKLSKFALNNVKNNKDDHYVLSVIKTDNYHGLKGVKKQGGLTLLHQSEHFEGFHFEYTFEDFKTDFLKNGSTFLWDEEFDEVLEIGQENEDIKNYNSYLSIDDYIFFILRMRSNTITTSYDEKFTLKRYPIDNEDDIYGMVILNEISFLFEERYVQYENIVKMFIKLFKITFKYVQNLFRNNNEQHITLRNKQGFKKLWEKENSKYEKSIFSKLNGIEKEISQLEKNLDDLINHIKGKPKCNEKNTICFSLLKICVPLVILFGFNEFQVRVKPKRIYN